MELQEDLEEKDGNQSDLFPADKWVQFPLFCLQLQMCKHKSSDWNQTAWLNTDLKPKAIRPWQAI